MRLLAGVHAPIDFLDGEVIYRPNRESDLFGKKFLKHVPNFSGLEVVMYDSAQEAFVKFGYMEMKDLLKAFITLISATLVASITLADKAGGYAGAPQASKTALMLSWVGLILSLITAGLSICFAAMAGVIASDPASNKVSAMAICYSQFSMAFVLVAGCLYVSALISMTYAAYRAMIAPQGQG